MRILCARIGCPNRVSVPKDGKGPWYCERCRR